MKEKRVTGRESTTVIWVSNYTIDLDLSLIHCFSWFSDSEMCKLDQIRKAAWVRTRYKFVAQRVNPISLADGSTAQAVLHDTSGSFVAREKSHMARDESRMTGGGPLMTGDCCRPEKSIHGLVQKH